MRTCFLIVTVTGLLLQGCVSTSHVHDFTQKTKIAFEKFENIPLTQAQVNKKEYDLSLIRKASILTQQQYNEGLLKSDNYNRAKEADSVTELIYTVCLNYFEALDYLSEKKIGAVKIDPLAAALKNGNYGGIEVTEKQMASYGKLATQSGNAITGAYQLKRLRDHIREGNDPLQVMLTKLNEIVSQNYLLDIGQERAFLQALYFDYSKDSTVSLFEKKNIALEYYASLRKLAVIEKQIQIYSKALTEMMKIHQRLHDSLDQLGSEGLKKDLAEYGSTLRTLIVAFNKLQP